MTHKCYTQVMYGSKDTWINIKSFSKFRILILELFPSIFRVLW